MRHGNKPRAPVNNELREVGEEKDLEVKEGRGSGKEEKMDKEYQVKKEEDEE